MSQVFHKEMYESYFSGLAPEVIVVSYTSKNELIVFCIGTGGQLKYETGTDDNNEDERAFWSQVQSVFKNERKDGPKGTIAMHV